MQSVLISSKNSEKAREEAEKIFKDLEIDKFDRFVFEFEKAVGIPGIREIQKKVYLKPFKGETKAILIDASLGITDEAQNALLKTLEEAPMDTIIVVLAKSTNDLLPTICSRCKIIEIKNKVEQNTKFSLETKDKLKLAQDLSKDKEEALSFLENSIIELHKDMLANHKRIRLLQRFYTIIKTTNANLRLALENLFLNI